MPDLLDHISSGKLKPEVIITHHLPLDDAARGYQIFNDKVEDCRKVVLTPVLRVPASTSPVDPMPQNL